MTDTVSPNVSARSRKSEQRILQALAHVGQKAVAEALGGVSNSTVSRIDWQTVSVALTALGLKVVSSKRRYVDEETYQFMRKKTVEHLSTEEGETDTGIHL